MVVIKRKKTKGTRGATNKNYLSRARYVIQLLCLVPKKILFLGVFVQYIVFGFAQTPPFSIQYGHTDRILDVAFSTNNKYLYSAGRDGLLNIWHLNTGYNIDTYKGFGGPIESIGILKEDSLLVAEIGQTYDRYSQQQSYQKKIALVDLKTKKISYPFEQPLVSQPYFFGKFSSLKNNQYLAGWTDDFLIVWNRKTGKIENFHKFPKGIQPLGYIDDGLLAINTSNNNIISYKVLKGNSVENLSTLINLSRLSSLRIHPNEKWLVYEDSKEQIVFVDIPTGQIIKSFPSVAKKVASPDKIPQKVIHYAHHDDHTIATLILSRPPIKFSPDFDPSKYKTFTDLILWDCLSGTVKKTQTFDHVLNVKFSTTSNNMILFGGAIYQPFFYLWNSNHHLTRKLEGKVGKIDVLEKDTANSRIAFADIDYNTIRLLDINTLKISSLQKDNTPNNEIGASTLAFSPSGKQLISSNWSNKVYLWNLNNFQLEKTLTSPEENEVMNYLSFGNNDSTILTGSEYKPLPRKPFFERQADFLNKQPINIYEQWEDKPGGNFYNSHLSEEDKSIKLKLWDIPTGSFEGGKQRHDDIFSIKYLPQIKQFVTIDYARGVPTVAWWDMLSGAQVDFLPMDYKDSKLRTFAISDNGQLFARSLENGIIEIYEDNGYKFELADSYTMNALSFSESGKYLAASSEQDNTISIWNIENRKKIKILKGHWNSIQHLSFFKEDAYLISCSIDGNMIYWDWNREELLFYCVSLRDNEESIIVSKDNYYKSTKNGVRALVLNDKNNTYSFEQFDLKLNRPDKVLATIPTVDSAIIKAYYNAYKKRLSDLDFTEEMLSTDFHVPSIEILTKSNSISTNEEFLELSVIANDEQEKLDRLNVWINDVPIYGRNGISLRTNNVHHWQQELSLPLSSKDNKIQISCLNQGGAESLKETLFITNERPPQKPNLHIIGLGVETYKDAKFNLNFPIKDANDIIETYQEQASFYKQIIVDTLYNEALTKENIKALKTKLLQSTIEDHILIFVAGHGIFDKNFNYYLASTNTDFNYPKKEAIPYEIIENLLDSIPARNKLLLIDACHSGEVDKTYLTKVKKSNQSKQNIIFRAVGDSTITYQQFGLDNSYELMRDLFVDLRRETGATVIASASGVEPALESNDWNNGAFVYTLKRALKNGQADLNNDNKIMISELQVYLYKEVALLTNGLQEPTYRIENISNDFRIW